MYVVAGVVVGGVSIVVVDETVVLVLLQLTVVRLINFPRGEHLT